MKYEIDVGAVDATIVTGDFRVADRLIACKDPALVTDASVRKKLCDGLIHFVDRVTGVMPAGLVPRLVRRLERRGHRVTVRERTVHQFEPIEPDYLTGPPFRDFQQESVDIGLEERRGIFWLATNAGKTMVIAGLAGKAVRDANMRVLVIVPNGYLLAQTSDDLKELLGPDVVVEKAGDGHRPKKPHVLVGTYQTLVQAIKSTQSSYSTIRSFVSRCGMVIVDEAHHASSSSHVTILRACENAYFRFGMTGSASNRDLTVTKKMDIAAKAHRRQMESYLGPVLARVSNQELIDRGVSATPTVYLVEDRSICGPTVRISSSPPDDDGDGAPQKKNVYNETFLTSIVQNRKFNRAIIKIVATLIAQGKPPFVFSHSIPHLHALREAAKALDVPHRMLYGDDPVERRRRVVEKYAAQNDFAILTSTVFDEGASIPAIKSLVFAGARKKVRELLQRVGRGLRAKKGDNTVAIVDINPLQSAMLSRHFRGRVSGYEAEGFTIRRINDVATIHTVTF
jgi:superfamily II DNA or RNA helicase